MRLALFDLDGTLLPTDSDHAFNEYVVGLGWADAADYRRRNDAFYADYLAGQLDIADYIDFATAPWRHRSEEEIAAASAGFIRDVMQPAIRERAQALVQRHRDAGDLLAIVTATNEFVTRPIADLFGIDALIATELSRDATGRITGGIAGVPAFREGKVTRVTDWLAQRGLKQSGLDSSTFYSDSLNDLPLLEWVSHPVATNPGPELQRLAEARRWPVLRLFDS